MIPVIVSGTPFKVEISPLEHLLLTWPMTFQSRGLGQFTDWSRMARRCGAFMCGVGPGKGHPFHLMYIPRCSRQNLLQF